MSESATHYRTCNLCEAMCGLEIQYQDKEVLSIRGDKQDPFSRGHICPKAVALKDIYEDPDRLKYPLRKTANGWEQLDWDTAFDWIVERLQVIEDRYGASAIGVYQGNPNVHNVGTMLTSPTFVRALKTKNRFSATSTDQLPHHLAALAMFGHAMLIPIPDVDRTQFMLIMGANPLVSNGSLMSAPDIAHRLQAIQKRGGKVIVIDPRRTQTAEHADVHHFIRPETDALLLLALVRTILVENLAQPDRLSGFTNGRDQLIELVEAFTPQKVAPICGIAEEKIVALARDFAGAEAAVCYGRIGLSTQSFGTLCQWLINVLNIITGNLDRPGGAMFTLPAVDQVEASRAKGRGGAFGRWKSRVRSLPEFGGELPAAAMAEEILTPGEGQIKALVTVAGNPVLSTPNGQQLDAALSQLDFMLSIDIYLNETTRHADIILPPTTGLETPHYDFLFHQLAIRNTAKYSPELFEKEPEQRHDWQIFQALTNRLNKQPHTEIPPEQMLGFALQNGPYSGEGVNLKKLLNAPHGIDLGPLKPCLPQRLFTQNNCIVLTPSIFVEDLQRLKNQFLEKINEVDATWPFQLIGRRQLRSNNSWMHNSERMVKGRDRCTLLIHPDDADRLNIANGQKVSIESRVGQIYLPAEISDCMMPGVVSIPHGWGHHHEGIRLSVAQAHAGASINDLTDHLRLDELSGNAAFCGVPVRVIA
ncbi:MAG: oxidoreductase [Saprospiraceae bacterium]|nr:MAG: oxidoreductase [Saprospiraceae bacterium]